MTIEELTCYTAQDVQDMDRLMHELSATSYCSEEKQRAVCEDADSHVYIIRKEGHIVATATLCVSHTPEFTLGAVEVVVALCECRGMGLGRRLMEQILTEAKRFGCEKLHLTSNPRRVAANGLYQALGFKLYSTNYYEYDIK
nr:GNAT family N-acetyltransferase [uncultured Bacteroides sp.]